MIPQPLPHEKIKQAEVAVAKKLSEERDSVFTRFPLVFTLLGSFGLVATFYGFEGIIDRIPILMNNPFIILGVGVGTLFLTGTLYKKLD